MDIVDRLESLGVSLNNSYSRQKTLNDASKEIQTLRAKVEVLEEYKNAVIDHFIGAFHGYDESKSVYDNLSLLIAYYQELALDPKVSKEASDLHAKVASVEVLVEALRDIECKDCNCDGWEFCRNNYQSISTKALATYDKLSEE